MKKKNNVLRWLRTHKIAVLKGGWSRERSISIKTAAAIEASFRRLKIKYHSLDVKPNILSYLQTHPYDFCFIALHGTFGEDGGMQSVLDFLKIPFNGSGTLASALSMDKALAKKIFKSKNIPTPEWMTLSKIDAKSTIKNSEKIVRQLLKKGPLFLKPTDQGSAIGARKMTTLSELKPALKACFKVSESALIERYIDGRELTVGILNGRALPVIEILPDHPFYDFHSKYAKGGSRHLVPAPLSGKKSAQVRALAIKAFRALGCSVYGRVDLLMDKRGNLTVLEVNTIPGMTDTSLLPEAARAVGLNFDQLVLKIIECSLHEAKII